MIRFILNILGRSREQHDDRTDCEPARPKRRVPMVRIQGARPTGEEWDRAVTTCVYIGAALQRSGHNVDLGALKDWT